MSNPRNPCPVVVGLILPELNKLVVVRRNIAPHKGGFALPGGYVEFGENWRDALRREIEEEAHIIVSPKPEHMQILDVASTPDGAHMLIFAVIRKTGIIATHDFTPNTEASERLIVTVDYYNQPNLCFPLHEEAVTHYRNATFSFQQAHPGGW